jgi:hypothetical protein
MSCRAHIFRQQQRRLQARARYRHGVFDALQIRDAALILSGGRPPSLVWLRAHFSSGSARFIGLWHRL